MPIATPEEKESTRALEEKSLTIYDVIHVVVIGSSEHKPGTEPDS